MSLYPRPDCNTLTTGQSGHPVCSQARVLRQGHARMPSPLLGSLLPSAAALNPHHSPPAPHIPLPPRPPTPAPPPFCPVSQQMTVLPVSEAEAGYQSEEGEGTG